MCLGHGVAQDARRNRMALGVIGVEQAVRRRALNHLSQFPAEIHRVLHADVEALSAHGRVYVGGVAGQEDAPVTVGRRLARHVGEAGKPGGAVDAVIGAVDGDERRADIGQCGFADRADVAFRQHDAHRVAVLQRTDGMDPERILVKAQLRFLGHLDLGDQPAHRRVPTGKVDARGLADQAAPAVAADHVRRPERRAVIERDTHAGGVLRETRHLAPAIDRHAQLADPGGQDALDVVLGQREAIGVPGGKVADIQPDHVEAGDLGHLTLGEEAVGDAALVKHLDGTRMQTARAPADKLLVLAPLDDGDVDTRQSKLARQHQPRRPAAGDHYGMLGHSAASPLVVLT